MNIADVNIERASELAVIVKDTLAGEKPHDVIGISMRNLDNCDARLSTSYIPDVKKKARKLRVVGWG